MNEVSKWTGVAGSLLVLAGLVWGAMSLKQLETKLRWEKAEIKRMNDESGNDSERFNQALRASGIRFATYNDQLYEHQDTQLAALEHVKPSFSGPYALTVLGALLGLVGAALA